MGVLLAKGLLLVKMLVYFILELIYRALILIAVCDFRRCLKDCSSFSVHP